MALLELFPLKFSEMTLQIATEPSEGERKKLSVGQWLKKCFLPYPVVNTSFILCLRDGCLAVKGPRLRLWLLSSSGTLQVLHSLLPLE